MDLYYAEVASVHIPGTPNVTGREAIVESFAPFTDMSNMQFEQVEVDGSGDLAYVYGTASFDMPGEGGQPVSSHFRYVAVQVAELRGRSGHRFLPGE